MQLAQNSFSVELELDHVFGRLQGEVEGCVGCVIQRLFGLRSGE